MSKLSEAIKEEFDADMRTIAELQKRIGELEAERDSLKLQAVAQAQEMRSHKSSLHEAYQYITGATGEPGNWNGARPIKEAVDKLRQALTAERQRREEADAALVELLGSHDNLYIAHFGEQSDPFIDISAKAARDYLDRYPSVSDNREKVAG
jgi:DNA repair exonuclease SbcCD ATPase subunit